MIVDLPNTSMGHVTKRLLSLRQDVGAMALSRVLTLVVAVDDEDVEDALSICQEATRQHPARIIVVVRANPRGVVRIDGQLRVGGDAGASEIVVLRLYGELTKHPEAVVLPLLLADSPVVAWWPKDAPKNPAQDAIGALAQRRITDSQQATHPPKQLSALAKAYTDGDTDLAWTRTTRWRAILAAALDAPPYTEVTEVEVSGAPESATADLLASWLGLSLECPVVRKHTAPGSGVNGVRLSRSSGDIELNRPDGKVAIMSAPGQPTQNLALPKLADAECLADELTRLDADEIYHRVLVEGLPRLGKAGAKP